METTRLSGWLVAFAFLTSLAVLGAGSYNDNTAATAFGLLAFIASTWLIMLWEESR